MKSIKNKNIDDLFHYFTKINILIYRHFLDHPKADILFGGNCDSWVFVILGQFFYSIFIVVLVNESVFCIKQFCANTSNVSSLRLLICLIHSLWVKRLCFICFYVCFYWNYSFSSLRLTLFCTVDYQDGSKSARKSLKTLQCLATDRENLVGRPSKSLKHQLSQESLVWVFDYFITFIIIVWFITSNSLSKMSQLENNF